jgi:uncharacterized protein
MSHVSTREQLREVYASPGERAVRKELDHLDRHCRRFLELSPFFVLATSNARGHADASPRGGPPGFVHVADDTTLVIPDHPGNNRLDNLENLLERPEVGLLFLIPGVDETLRVNGPVEIRTDPELRERVATGGKTPKAVLVVTVRQAFLHCAKAFMRSRLWHPEARVERSELPTLGEMLKDQLRSSGPAETRQEMLERYRKALY